MATKFPVCKKGENHPAYKNGSGKYDERNRLLSIELLGLACQECGTTKDVELHHIDKNPKNNAHNNWWRLCVSCHKYTHIYRYVPTEEEKKIFSKRKKQARVERWKERAKQQALKGKTPAGYFSKKETLDFLQICPQRLYQIKKRLGYISVGEKKGFVYLKEAVFSYKKNKTMGKPKKEIPPEVKKSAKELHGLGVPISCIAKKFGYSYATMYCFLNTKGE